MPIRSDGYRKSIRQSINGRWIRHGIDAPDQTPHRAGRVLPRNRITLPGIRFNVYIRPAPLKVPQVSDCDERTNQPPQCESAR